MTAPHAITIEGTPPDCRVTLDGRPVHASALHLQLAADGTALAGLVLPLGGLSATRLHAAVTIDDATRDLLLALGWTPPPHGAPQPPAALA